MPRTFTGLLLAASLLTGCSDCLGPVPLPVAEAPAARPEASLLNGISRYFGKPLTEAAISVRRVGETEVLATGTSDAEGKFRLQLPNSIEPGRLIEVIAIKDGKRVANLTKVPARTLLQEAILILDENATAALFVLLPRIMAATKVTQTRSVEAESSVLRSFQAAVQAIANSPTPLTPAAFERAAEALVTGQGEIKHTEKAKELLAQLIPQEIVPAVVAQADSLATVIRENKKPEDQLPEEQTGAVPLGGKVAPPVFTEDTSSSGDKPAVTPKAEERSDPPPPIGLGGLEIASGTVVDTTASGTISFGR